MSCTPCGQAGEAKDTVTGGFRGLCNKIFCKLPYGQECKGAYFILLLIPILIIIYWIYLLWRSKGGCVTCPSVIENDFLNQKVLDMPYLENCCSWWPITHFVLFFILGVLFPNCEVLIIGAGIIWELVEMLMSSAFGRSRQPIRAGANVEYSTNWWAGSAKDVLFNITGFYLGKWYRTMWGEILEAIPANA